MIALLVLISVVASHVQIDRQKELLSTHTISMAIDSLKGFSKKIPATTLYFNKTAMRLLSVGQTNVIWGQIACEARPELHAFWKKIIKNQTKNSEELALLRQSRKVDCDNKTTLLPHHDCLCDESSARNFCHLVLNKYETRDNRDKAERMIGEKVPCADVLWKEVVVLNNNQTTFLHSLEVNGTYINIMAKLYADFTNNKFDVAHVIQQHYRKSRSSIEAFCFLTPKVHRVMQKLRNSDIRFRMLDDLLRMKFLSMVAFNFCNEDYLLSKCLCAEDTSSIFCTTFFFKQAAFELVNETICDGWSGNNSLTSTASTFFSNSIIAILLLFISTF